MSDGNTVSQNVETQTVLDNNITVQVAQEVQEQITIGVPGPRGPVGPMGSGVAWRGPYDPATAYELHEAVSYLGSSYACFVPCTGVVPTEASNWEIVASKGETGADGVSDIPGPKGETGLTGAKGDTGSQGIQGIKGDTGLTGSQGIQGIQGEIGVTGDTGADSTVAGAKGDTGEQGIQGPVGPTGTQGIQGTIGDTGADGTDGVTPVKGVDYFDGADGAKGETGATGADSTVAGPKGDTGDTGATGAAGTTDYTALSNKPTLGTAAAKNIPAAGNATATEVVYGSDTRLADTRDPKAHNQALATISDVTCTAAEINKLAGLTATAAELTYVHGVTSAIQTQIAAKKADNVSASDKILGRVTAGAGAIEEIPCTPFARTVLDDANAAAILATLGAAAYSEGTWTPTLTGFTIVGSTPATTGTYKRIGNVVFASCNILAGQGGNTTIACPALGTAYVFGLPISAVINAGALYTDDYAIGLGIGTVQGAGVYSPIFTATNHTILVTTTYFV